MFLSLKNQILTHRKMSTIDRLSGTMKNRRYSLAEHSYYVAAMFQDFAGIEGIIYTVDDLYLVLRHDYLEVLTADLIYPVKNFSTKTKEAWETIEKEIIQSEEKNYMNLFSDELMRNEMEPIVHRLVKDCDLLELYLFCYEEVLLGNMSNEIKHILEVLKESLNRTPFESIKEFLNELSKDFQEMVNYYKGSTR